MRHEICRRSCDGRCGSYDEFTSPGSSRLVIFPSWTRERRFLFDERETCVLLLDGVGSSARIEIWRMLERSSEYSNAEDMLQSMKEFVGEWSRRACGDDGGGLCRVLCCAGEGIFHSSSRVAPARELQGSRALLRGHAVTNRSTPRIQRRRAVALLGAPDFTLGPLSMQRATRLSALHQQPFLSLRSPFVCKRHTPSSFTQSIPSPTMSAPMIAWQPIAQRLYKYATTWGSSSSQSTFDLEPVTVHDVEHLPEKRSRTLKHLLKANHINHSILYHHLQFSNHTPHILCSAYLLGANEDQLHHIYDEESKELEEWQDSPAEISHDDWRLFLGKREYQRAYVDFFEDELALKHDYDWKTVAMEFLFEGKTPLINCAISNGKLHQSSA